MCPWLQSIGRWGCNDARGGSKQDSLDRVRTMTTAITQACEITVPGDYYLANDITITNVNQLVGGAALYITAAGVRINMNGKKVRGVGLDPNYPSFGVKGEATNNLVLFDGQVGGVTGFWCGVASATPWTRLQELDLSGNFYLGVNMTAPTGSASGGMSIALATIGQRTLEQATQLGIPAEVLHRVAAMASGGMDTLPHNGAVITLLAVTGLTHRQSYGDIFAMTLIKTAAVFVVIAFYYLTHLY